MQTGADSDSRPLPRPGSPLDPSVTQESGLSEASGEGPVSIGWLSPGLWALMALAAGVFCLAWWRTEGYPLADAIGYVDRAKTFVETGELQPAERNLRSFAFPLLFTPIFTLCELLGIHDLRFALPLSRAMQLVLAVACVAASVRLGARLFGATAGFVGGAFVALCPTFVAHATMPVADIASTLCLALAYERLLRRPAATEASERGLWKAGLVAGLSFLISYKTLVVHVLFGLALFLRDRLRRWRSWFALGVGLTACTLFQIAVDKLIYGQWGHSVLNYLYDNVFGTLTGLTFRLAPKIPIESIQEGLYAVGTWSYELLASLREYEVDTTASPGRQFPDHWYLSHMYDFLALPVIALTLIGLARLLRPWRIARAARFGAWTVALVVTVYVVLLSQKGNKSFRLLIPLLPLWMPFCAWAGMGVLAWARERLTPGLVRVCLGLFWLATFGLCAFAFERTEPRAFGGYWQAIDYVNAKEAKSADSAGEWRSPPSRVASAHYFAIFLRNSERVHHESFRVPPWQWEQQRTPEADAIRSTIRRTFERLDWALIAHRQLLGRPTLFRAAQANFALETAFWDPGAHSPLVGPVYVLKRRDPADPHPRRFFQLERERAPAEWRVERGLDAAPNPEAPIDFVRELGEGEPGKGERETLTLLGVELESLPASDQSWLTWHWSSPSGFAQNFRVFARWVDSEGKVIGSSDHWLCYGEFDASSWQPGWILTEGYAVGLHSLTPHKRPGVDEPEVMLEVRIGTVRPDASFDPDGRHWLALEGADAEGWSRVASFWRDWPKNPGYQPIPGSVPSVDD